MVSKLSSGRSKSLDHYKNSDRQIGGGISSFFTDQLTSLDNNMVINIIQNSTEDKISTLPPVKPKGGEVYLVQSKHLDDWKCDQYTWINRSGMGNYHLKVELKRAFIHPSDLILPKRVVCPDEVIEYLKNEKQLHQVEKLIPDTPSDNKQKIVEKTHVQTEITSVNIKDDKTVIKKECDDTVNQVPVINVPVFNTDSSQQSLARFIVENNLITLVQQGAFIVNGQKGKYCVTLFPKETCQCVSTSTCYHILAAKMSIGLEAFQKNRVVNLRALSENSKKNIDNKSGRKQPRVNDYEIEFEPAPDSAFTLNTPLKQNVMKTPSTVGIVKPTP